MLSSTNPLNSYPFITRARVVASAILGLLSLFSPVAAGAAELSKVDEYFSQLHAKGEFTGSVLIAEREKIQLHAAYGLANEESRAKLEPDTPHRIASVTKGFTAVLALQAVDRRELALDESLIARFPEVKRPDLAGITLRHLLTHGSGLADFAPEPREGESMNAALLRGLADAKSENAPGGRFAYANVNYTLVAALLERATGKSYAALLQERIVQPAGMTSTYLDIGEAAKRPRAAGYELQNGTLVRNEEPGLERFTGAGNLVSTTTDLFRFSRALATDALLSPASRKLMQSPQLERYAMGCAIMNPPTGEVVELFLGGMPSVSAVLARFNDGERTIVILSNRYKVPTNRIIPQVHRLLTTTP